MAPVHRLIKRHGGNLRFRQAALKSVSFFVASLFLLQQASWAAPSVLKPVELRDPNLLFKTSLGLGLVPAVAIVDDAYLAPSAKTIYIMQDAHTNESGQMNLAKALASLIQKKNIRYVFTEAGINDNSLTFLKQFGSKKERERVGKAFVKKGLINGNEYLSLVSDRDFVIWGVEDKELYAESLEHYHNVSQERIRYQQYLHKIQTTLDFLKPRVLNKHLLRFLRHHENYKQGKGRFTDYLDVLMKEARREGIKLRGDSHLKTLHHIRQTESHIDFDRANEEQSQIYHSLPPQDQEELLKAHQNHKPATMSAHDEMSLQGFYALLEAKIREHQTAPPGELAKYFAYLKEIRRIDTQRVFQEMQSLEDRVFESLAAAPDESILIEAQRLVWQLDQLFELQMTPSDYRLYMDRKEENAIQSLTGFLNRKIMDLKGHYERAVFLEEGFEDILERAEGFYRLTLQRDNVFLDRLLAKMDAERQTDSILIAGGYHTPNLKDLLRKRNISFVSVAPQVVHETDVARYERLLLSQTIGDYKGTDIAGKKSLFHNRHAARIWSAVKTGALEAENGVIMAIARSLKADINKAQELYEKTMTGDGPMPPGTRVRAEVMPPVEWEDDEWKGSYAIFKVWQTAVTEKASKLMNEDAPMLEEIWVSFDPDGEPVEIQLGANELYLSANGRITNGSAEYNPVDKKGYAAVKNFLKQMRYDYPDYRGVFESFLGTVSPLYERRLNARKTHVWPIDFNDLSKNYGEFKKAWFKDIRPYISYGDTYPESSESGRQYVLKVLTPTLKADEKKPGIFYFDTHRHRFRDQRVFIELERQGLKVWSEIHYEENYGQSGTGQAGHEIAHRAREMTFTKKSITIRTGRLDEAGNFNADKTKVIPTDNPPVEAIRLVKGRELRADLTPEARNLLKRNGYDPIRVMNPLNLVPVEYSDSFGVTGTRMPDDKRAEFLHPEDAVRPDLQPGPRILRSDGTHGTRKIAEMHYPAYASGNGSRLSQLAHQYLLVQDDFLEVKDRLAAMYPPILRDIYPSKLETDLNTLGFLVIRYSRDEQLQLLLKDEFFEEVIANVLSQSKKIRDKVETRPEDDSDPKGNLDDTRRNSLANIVTVLRNMEEKIRIIRQLGREGETTDGYPNAGWHEKRMLHVLHYLRPIFFNIPEVIRDPFPDIGEDAGTEDDWAVKPVRKAKKYVDEEIYSEFMTWAATIHYAQAGRIPADKVENQVWELLNFVKDLQIQDGTSPDKRPRFEDLLMPRERERYLRYLELTEVNLVRAAELLALNEYQAFEEILDKRETLESLSLWRNLSIMRNWVEGVSRIVNKKAPGYKPFVEELRSGLFELTTDVDFGLNAREKLHQLQAVLNTLKTKIPGEELQSAASSLGRHLNGITRIMDSAVQISGDIWGSRGSAPAENAEDTLLFGIDPRDLLQNTVSELRDLVARMDKMTVFRFQREHASSAQVHLVQAADELETINKGADELRGTRTDQPFRFIQGESSLVRGVRISGFKEAVMASLVVFFAGLITTQAWAEPKAIAIDVPVQVQSGLEPLEKDQTVVFDVEPSGPGWMVIPQGLESSAVHLNPRHVMNGLKPGERGQDKAAVELDTRWASGKLLRGYQKTARQRKSLLSRDVWLDAPNQDLVVDVSKIFGHLPTHEFQKQFGDMVLQIFPLLRKNKDRVLLSWEELDPGQIDFVESVLNDQTFFDAGKTPQRLNAVTVRVGQETGIAEDGNFHLYMPEAKEGYRLDWDTAKLSSQEASYFLRRYHDPSIGKIVIPQDPEGFHEAAALLPEMFLRRFAKRLQQEGLTAPRFIEGISGRYRQGYLDMGLMRIAKALDLTLSVLMHALATIRSAA